MPLINQQNCNICDKHTWLVHGYLFEVSEVFHRHKSDRAVVLFAIHKCKEAEDAPD